MKKTALASFLLTFAGGLCFADSSDDTLKFYLSKSDFVAVGFIASQPSAKFTEDGVPNYICDFKAKDVLKGDGNLADKTIQVNIRRFEMGEKDHHPLIKKDAECILFLKKQPKGNAPQWATADFWFGVQHPSPWMARSLKRLSKEKSADSSDDTLKFYLSKSDFVVRGTIANHPEAIFDEIGVPNYYCEFKIADVLKGDAKLKDKTLKLNIMRFEMDKKDRHPLIKKDAECIVFLKKQTKGTVPHWFTADFWFGIQHPSPWMAKSLKRLAKEKNVEPTDAPDKK